MKLYKHRKGMKNESRIFLSMPAYQLLVDVYLLLVLELHDARVPMLMQIRTLTRILTLTQIQIRTQILMAIPMAIPTETQTQIPTATQWLTVCRSKSKISVQNAEDVRIVSCVV